MNSVKLTFGLVVAAVAVSGCMERTSSHSQSTLQTSVIETVQAQASATQTESHAMSLMNAERTKKGLSTYGISPALIKAAQLHAKDMTAKNYFSHTGQNGSNVKRRVRSQGYKGCFWAENIASGHKNALEVISAWMKSAPHRKNILSRKADELGIGRSGNIWVAVFAKTC